MTIFVLNNGKLVEKRTIRTVSRETAPDFPTPRISRLEPYESPIDGHEVRTWGEREREMREHDCYDPRDFGPGHVYEKGRVNNG